MLADVPAIDVREPVGEDELFLLETRLAPAPALAALAERVATVAGRRPDWEQVAAAHLGAVALAIRRAWIGDRVLSNGCCPRPDCRERVDIGFSSLTYLTYHRPRMPRNALASDDGWYRLSASQVRFRIPAVADLLAAGDSADPTATLATRCLRPAELPARTARAVDRALSALAPNLEGPVGGPCPVCGTQVELLFDPVAYTILELRDAFAGLYRETHALACAYGWLEETILRLPRNRRRRYAEMVFEDRSYRVSQLGAAW